MLQELRSLSPKGLQPDGGVQDNSLSEDSVPPLPPPLQLSPSPAPIYSHCITKPKQLSCSAPVTAKRPFPSLQPIPNHRQLLSIPPSAVPSLKGSSFQELASNSQELAPICSPFLADSIPHSPQDFNATVSSFKVR